MPTMSAMVFPRSLSQSSIPWNLPATSIQILNGMAWDHWPSALELAWSTTTWPTTMRKRRGACSLSSSKMSMKSMGWPISRTWISIWSMRIPIRRRGSSMRLSMLRIRLALRTCLNWSHFLGPSISKEFHGFPRPYWMPTARAWSSDRPAQKGKSLMRSCRKVWMRQSKWLSTTTLSRLCHRLSMHLSLPRSRSRTWTSSRPLSRVWSKWEIVSASPFLRQEMSTIWSRKMRSIGRSLSVVSVKGPWSIGPSVMEKMPSQRHCQKRISELPMKC